MYKEADEFSYEEKADMNRDIAAGLGHAPANYYEPTVEVLGGEAPPATLAAEGVWRKEVVYPIGDGSASNTYSPVENPKHYQEGFIECIDALRASMSYEEYKGYLKGAAFKYLWRYRYKGHPIEDLEKSIWYSQRLTTLLKEEEIVRSSDRIQSKFARGEAQAAERDLSGSGTTGSTGACG